MVFPTQSNRHKKIANSLSGLLIEYLRAHVFREETLDDLEKRLGLDHSVVHQPWFSDVPRICEAAGLDLGLTIRDTRKNTVTFWPSENFSTPTQVTNGAEAATLEMEKEEKDGSWPLDQGGSRVTSHPQSRQQRHSSK